MNSDPKIRLVTICDSYGKIMHSGHPVPFVAFRINCAISFGCDTSDAWLALIDKVVAFICFAKRRWASGVSLSSGLKRQHVIAIASRNEASTFEKYSIPFDLGQVPCDKIIKSILKMEYTFSR